MAGKESKLMSDLLGKAFVRAAVEGDAKKVREILVKGADINTVEPTNGLTCLHIACLNGDADVVRVLLEHHAKHGDLDFTIRSKNPERFAWQLAMSAHHYDIANAVDAASQTPKKPPLSPTPT